MLQLFGSTAVLSGEDVLVYGRVTGADGHETQETPTIVGAESPRSGAAVVHEVIWSEDRPDFALRLATPAPFSLRWANAQGREHTELVQPHLAFEAPHLALNQPKRPREERVAISTMTLGDEDRLEEWVRYHTELGATDFLLFHNQRAPSAVLESLAPKGVSVVSFPFSSAEGEHWNNVQRGALNIGAAALREKVAFIAFIDVDEFIGVPNSGSLLDLMRHAGSAQLKGSVLTNLGRRDAVQNNVLALADRFCEEASPKIVLATADLLPVPFVRSPHEHPAAAPLTEHRAKLFHMWLNERCSCAPDAPRVRLDGRTHWQETLNAPHRQGRRAPLMVIVLAILLVAAAFILIARKLA